MHRKGIFIPKSFYCFVGDEGNEGGAGAAPAVKPVTTADLEKIVKDFQSFVEKQGKGDVNEAGLKLWQEKYELRERLREAERERDELKSKLPPEGATVLTGKKLEAYQAYLQLGTPEEVKAKMEKADTLESETAEIRRNNTLRDVADHAEVDGKPVVFAVLKDVAGNLEYEVKEDNGKKVVNVLVPDGNNKKAIAFADYAKTNLAHHLPSLTGSAKSSNGYVKQDAGGKAPAENKWTQIRKKAEADRKKAAQSDKPLEERLNLKRSA